jgi:DNA-binding MarR family transcriptional regulator
MLEKQRSGSRQLSEPIGVLIAAARRGIKQATGARLRGVRLSPQQFWVLMAVQEKPGLSLRDLCDRRRMDAPTASRVVATLVAKRLLRSAGDRDDRRRCHLDLTADGDALASRLEPLLHETRRAFVSGMSEAEQETLRDLLRRVIANAARAERRPAAVRPPGSPDTMQETSR